MNKQRSSSMSPRSKRRQHGETAPVSQRSNDDKAKRAKNTPPDTNERPTGSATRKTGTRRSGPGRTDTVSGEVATRKLRSMSQGGSNAPLSIARGGTGAPSPRGSDVAVTADPNFPLRKNKRRSPQSSM